MDIKQIEFFKQKLEERIEELLSQAEQTIQEIINQELKEIENIDRASSNADQALKLKIRNRESRLIKKVRQALERIEDGTYGICELCGEDISLRRLEARPVTTKCIKCKQEEERMEVRIK